MTMFMRQMLLCVGVLGAVIYMKYLMPGFADGFMPMLREWLVLEQVSVPVPAEAMVWLGLG